MKLKGIDVSKHQGRIDWDRVKADGIDFAMIRMGYGSDLESQDDPQFERNVKECERVGLPWGAYLYSYALTTEQAYSEAEHIKRLMKGKHNEFPVAFDMEDGDNYKTRHGMPSKETLVDICYIVLDEIEDEDQYVMLYASKSWLNGRLKSDKLDRFDKWVAQWNETCTYKGDYSMWQYTSKGHVWGIDGNVDMNEAYTNYNYNTNNHVPRETYTVQSGDTLSEIANKFDSTVETLMIMNPSIEDEDKIFVHQNIEVPKKHDPVKQYLIRSGDTLSKIADKFDTTVRHLMEINPDIQNKRFIYAGDMMKVPKR